MRGLTLRVVVWAVLLALVVYGVGHFATTSSLDWQLLQASYAGDVPRITRLRRAGANPKNSIFGTTALQAASSGYMDRLGVSFITGVHPELFRIERALE